MPFHVVFLGERRNSGGIPTKLTCMLKDDFSPAVVALHLALNLDLSPLQAADIADPLQVAGKHNHRKRRSALILAEVEEMHARVSLFDAEDFLVTHLVAPIWFMASENDMHSANADGAKLASRMKGKRTVARKRHLLMKTRPPSS